MRLLTCGSIIFLTACSTVKPVVLAPIAAERPLPVEAMEACGALPTLSAGVINLPLDEALKEVIKSKVAADEIYKDCVLRHKALVEWIESDAK